MKIEKKLGAIIQCGFLPIVVNDGLDPILLASIIKEADLPAIEVTLRKENAVNVIKKIKKYFPELIILCGSTIDEKQTVKFLKKREGYFPSIEELYHLGVDGIVSMLPFSKKTYNKYKNKLLFIPGVETVAQAFEQISWGAHLIKFFNTENFGGAQRIKTIQGATHNTLPILVTGGMRLEKIFEYVEARVLVIGAGFDIILENGQQNFQGNLDKVFIKNKLLAYVKRVKESRKKTNQQYLSEEKNTDKLLKMTGRFIGNGR